MEQEFRRLLRAEFIKIDAGRRSCVALFGPRAPFPTDHFGSPETRELATLEQDIIALRSKLGESLETDVLGALAEFKSLQSGEREKIISELHEWQHGGRTRAARLMIERLDRLDP